MTLFLTMLVRSQYANSCGHLGTSQQTADFADRWALAAMQATSLQLWSSAAWCAKPSAVA